MYHWNMSLRYHDIVLHLKNLQNPHLDEKISSIFWWFTLTIETYNDFLEKKLRALFKCQYFFSIWSFLCFRFFGFFMLVQKLAQVHRFKVSITSISNGGWNPAIGRREISIFVPTVVSALGTTIHSVAGTLVGNNVHSLSAFLDFNEIFPRKLIQAKKMLGDCLKNWRFILWFMNQIATFRLFLQLYIWGNRWTLTFTILPYPHRYHSFTRWTWVRGG